MYMDEYVRILKEELVPAFGCTEPIAIAYASAKLCETLDSIPTKVVLKSSGNIIKNAKSAVVPNTGGLKGMEVSCLAGIVACDSSKGLEVLNNISESELLEIHSLLQKQMVVVERINSPAKLHIIVEGYSNDHSAYVELIHGHTNIVLVKKDESTVFEKPFSYDDSVPECTDRSCLNVKDIIEFANTVDINLVKDVLELQEKYNMEIAKYGLTMKSSLGVCKGLLDSYQQKSSKSIEVQVKAELAGAIEARLSGSPHPVVTNSGSGTQGLSVSVPILVFARELGISHEKTLRCLIVGNLLAIHQKTGVGKLSAFCGAVSATAAASAAIVYMNDGSYEQISNTITTSLSTITGLICDGAKVSCATKAVIGMEAGFLAYHLAMENNVVESGDGIVKDDIEKTIQSVGIVASQGMRQTDDVILDVMLK